MVTGYNYSSFVTQLATLAVVDEADPNFLQNLPSAIDSAELRIMQDLDLLNTRLAQTGYSLTPNVRSISISQATFIVLEQVNVITPVGQTNPDLPGNVRNPCTPVDKSVLDFLWPSSTGAGVPSLFAMFDANTILFGPWPAAAYSLEIIGTQRPVSLSASHTSTFISLYLPDLFMAAAMIYIAGYQRDFGRQSDDPQLAVSWQSFYDRRLAASLNEENRKKFQASAWTSMTQPITSTPSRDIYPKAG